MTVRLAANGTIELIGDCPSDDAEVLLQHLVRSPGATVDWKTCESAHAAVIQVLMALRPKVEGQPSGSILAKWVQPVLEHEGS